MNASSERQFIRILHLLLSIPIAGYIYGPIATIPEVARFTRRVAMPVVVLSGLWLWLKPRLLGWLWRQHSSPARRTLISICASLSLFSSVSTAQYPEVRVGDAFPYFSAQTVTGRPLLLPKEALGKTALVIFTFGRASGKDGQTWNLRLAKDFPSGVPNYTLIFAESVPKMFQGRALSGIRSGMPREMQDRAALVLRDEKKWRTLLGVKDYQRAYVLLVGTDGRIIWRSASSFTEGDYALVKSRLITH